MQAPVYMLQDWLLFKLVSYSWFQERQQLLLNRVCIETYRYVYMYVRLCELPTNWLSTVKPGQSNIYELCSYYTRHRVIPCILVHGVE